jgi:lipopolysaccharide/colanic/teichoic acid biosynthesis glycosyltransferase
MIKRTFDFLMSMIGILLLSPIFIIISISIAVDSRGGVFYKQERIGRGRKPFKLLKFRSMKTGSDKKGLLTVGSNDSRVTKIGLFIRKYKLDELPQLINILLGDMSFVGPRPEVKKYVDLYTKEQLKVLDVRPGLTDYASLAYFDENELLSKSANPEDTYIHVVMPAKLRLNFKYLKNKGFITDIGLILKTIKRIIQ